MKPSTYIIQTCFILICFFGFFSDCVKAEEALPGQSLFDENKYVEYIVGNYPLIISVPHGGRLVPVGLPDRKHGVLLSDRNTDLIALEMIASFYRQTKKYPHVIICKLKRVKLDCNRAVKEAAQGNVIAEKAWSDYHRFVKQAREEVMRENGGGIFIDLHGHGHPEARLELGYLLTNQQLKSSDKELSVLQKKSSIRQLAGKNKASFVELLRGRDSLGALMQKGGYATVPSPKLPDAGDAKYFSGGYNIHRYGSLKSGKINAIQVECPWLGVRDTEKHREEFARTLVAALLNYMNIYSVVK